MAVLKAVCRRRRPAKNQDDMFMTVGPDVYAFPSGHVSRSCYIAYFFLVLSPLPLLCRPPLLAWVSAVSVSRLLLRRHHVLDVLAGIVLGLVNSLLISLIWLGPDAAVYLISYISDEKVEGGEYHV